jgi:hypothetical protein
MRFETTAELGGNPHRKEVRRIEEAKREATREVRVAKTVQVPRERRRMR